VSIMRLVVRIATGMLLAAAAVGAWQHYHLQRKLERFETSMDAPAPDDSRTPLQPDERCVEGTVFRTIYSYGGAVGREQEQYGMRPARCIEGWRLDPR